MSSSPATASRRWCSCPSSRWPSTWWTSSTRATGAKGGSATRAATDRESEALQAAEARDVPGELLLQLVGLPALLGQLLLLTVDAVLRVREVPGQIRRDHCGVRVHGVGLVVAGLFLQRDHAPTQIAQIQFGHLLLGTQQFQPPVPVHLQLFHREIGGEQHLVCPPALLLLGLHLAPSGLEREFLGRLLALDHADGHALLVQDALLLVPVFGRHAVAVVDLALVVDPAVDALLLAGARQEDDRECRECNGSCLGHVRITYYRAEGEPELVRAFGTSPAGLPGRIPVSLAPVLHHTGAGSP